jgi:hypothetical protein
VLFQGPELANRALDILAMAGMATMALADVWSCHVAWWPTPQASVIRIWCSAALTLKIEASAVVHGPDGAVRSAETGATPQWHESMRYLRMSETTDDLFDAFRNVYLALESLLNRLQPRTPGEGEGTWLKRALTWSTRRPAWRLTCLARQVTRCKLSTMSSGKRSATASSMPKTRSPHSCPRIWLAAPR